MTMAANRIRRYTLPTRAASTDHSAVETIPQGFDVCPPQFAAASGWQQEIYSVAYKRAQAAAQIPRHHRRLFCVWN